MGSTLRLRLSTATGHELRASRSFALRVTATLSVKNAPAFVRLSVTEGDGNSTQAPLRRRGNIHELPAYG